MAQAPSLWGNAIDGFTNALSNPLTLGGLSLLSGGDLNQGIAAGTQLQKQAQQQRQMQAFQQGIQGMPNLTDNDRAILSSSPDLATSVLGEIYKNRFDPNAALNTQYKQAQIKKLQAEAADAGSTYGKAGTIVQGNDGKFYSVQFGSRGQRQILPLELGGTPGTQPAPTGAPSAAAPPANSVPSTAAPSPVGLSPARGTYRVGNTIYDAATGRPVQDASASVAGGKSAEAQGDAQGKAAVNLPLAENSAARILGAIDTLLAPNSGLDRVTGTVYGRLPEWTNTSDEAKTAQSQIDYINSNTFLQAYNDLRGAGAITEREGAAAQAAYSRLRSQQLGTDAYKKALMEYRQQVQNLLNIARARAQGGNVVGASQGQAQPQAPAAGGWSIKRID